MGLAIGSEEGKNKGDPNPKFALGSIRTSELCHTNAVTFNYIKQKTTPCIALPFFPSFPVASPFAH